MTVYKRGDVVLVNYPDSNLRTVKPRPALVVQDDALATGLAQVIVAMITSNLAWAGAPSRIVIRLGDSLAVGTNLLTDSVIVVDNLATVRTALIRRAIGHLPSMTPVDTALRMVLGL